VGLVLGLDIGTTGVKAVALDPEGRLVAEASMEHHLSSPRPGWAEEDPAAWWANVTGGIRQLGREIALDSVAAVGVSGMVPALVLLGADGRVLRPSIQQNDARTGEEIAWLAERLDQPAFFAATGQPLSQQLIFPKLLWLRRHEPSVYQGIHRILGSYDYVTFRLTGERALEQNWALESGLWDALVRRWYRPVLELAEIPEEWLAPVREPHDVVGKVTQEAAETTGLPAGTPVIAGSADHVAAALAAGTGPGELVLKLGGAGDVLYGVDHFAPDPRLFIDYHDLPGRFLLNGCMVASGSLVKWFAEACARDLADRENRYALLDAEAEEAPPGCDGLLVLPYFLGEKTPVFDPAARGVFFGLTLHHARGHLHRAILEGVAYGFRHHVEVLEAGGHSIRSVRIMDRGARSRLWRQLIADVLGRPIAYAPAADLGSAYGVAWVAGVAGGFWDWQRKPPMKGDAMVHEPVPAVRDLYAGLYRVYRDLYTHLRPDFRAVGGLLRASREGGGG
jgi:xylulokinase